ncbi:MAG: LptF/LptG family permease [Rhodobacter sp.]|nr:LptF/LptG family permease [Rhodobacter sp.]
MVRLLRRRTMRTVWGILLLVEVIFLSDTFTSVMERAVSNGGNALDVALLLLYRSPQMIDFALPLALMLGVYFAITAARDDSELIICASAGVRWQRIPVYALWVGFLGFVASLLLSGFVIPMSFFAMRLTMQDLQARYVVEQLTTPGPSSAIRQFEGRTIIATPSSDPDAERGHVFVYNPEANGAWRVSQADDWTVVGPNADDGYQIQLEGFRDYIADRSAPEIGQEPADGGRATLDFATINVRNVTLDFEVSQVVEAADEARRGHELYLYQIGLGLPLALGDAAAAEPTRRFGEMLARALLCPVAALIAVAGASWAGTRPGRYLALPAAAVAVLVADILGRAALGDAAALGAQGFWLSTAATFAVGLLVPLAYILIRGEAMITPNRGAG